MGTQFRSEELQGRSAVWFQWLICFWTLLPMCGAPEINEVIDVAPVWSGHPVGFHSLVASNRQFVAFYDADRQLTVAMRLLPATNWTFARLPERVGWDSHNYVTMALDKSGYLHLSGNMHVNPLINAI